MDTDGFDNRKRPAIDALGGEETISSLGMEPEQPGFKRVKLDGDDGEMVLLGGGEVGADVVDSVIDESSYKGETSLEPSKDESGTNGSMGIQNHSTSFDMEPMGASVDSFNNYQNNTMYMQQPYQPINNTVQQQHHHLYQDQNSAQDRRKSTVNRKQFHFIESVIKAMRDMPTSIPFREPVDPIKLGIPDYLKVITRPMDISTIIKKLHAGEYESTEEVADDVKTMFNNSYKYNGRDHFVSKQAMELEKYFEDKMKRLDEVPVQSYKVENPLKRSISDSQTLNSQSGTATDHPSGTGKKKSTRPLSELDFCKKMIKEFMRHKKYDLACWPFREPVDPVRMGIPQYFDIVKTPMDLSTIEKKLDTRQYTSGEEVKRDVELMLNNCFIFNPPDHDVYKLGKAFEDIFAKRWAEKPSPPPPGAPLYSESRKTGTGGVTKKPSQPRKKAAKPAKPVKTQGASSAHPEELSSSESDSDESSESEDEDADDKQIAMLSQSLQIMQSQLMMLMDRKNKKIKKKKKSKKNSGSSHSLSTMPMLADFTTLAAPKPSKSKKSKASSFASGVTPSTSTSAAPSGVSKKPSSKPGTSKAKSNAPSSSKKKGAMSSSGIDEEKEMSFTQKKELSEKITMLSNDALQKVVMIIQQSMPQLQEEGQEEIELDVEQLDKKTLWRLYNFVMDATKPAGSANISGKRDASSSDSDSTSDSDSDDSD